ncbi:MAG: FtsQ-type POTRA domain-containing protein [Clostridia bacterium]|nr:FtsQ-type POTRA domain-containing protein [Clostridia bacterium]
MKYINKKKDNGKVVKLKNYKRRAKINKLKRKLLLLSLIIIILTLILLFTPLLQIKKINCTGNSKISVAEIVEASKIKIGDNLIRTSKSRVIDLINDIPYIKSVEVSKKLPSTINISIVECKVHSYVEVNKKYIYLDDEGKVLEISDKLLEQGRTLLVAGKVKSHEVNQIIEFENDSYIDTYKTLVQMLESSAFSGMVTNIDIADASNLNFTVNEEFTVVLGDMDNLDYKINILATDVYNSPESTKTGIIEIIGGNVYLKPLPKE